MQQLFVYGTLLFPEIIEKLSGKNFETVPAFIRGFIRKRIVGCDYPVVIQNLNSEVKGLLVRNVDEQSMQLLTFYEGDEYEKMETDVWIENEKTTAFVFVWKNNSKDLEENDWDENEFRQKHLKAYLNKVIPETRNDFKSRDSCF